MEVGAVAAGHRREKLEVWKDAGDRDLGRHELKLDVAKTLVFLNERMRF